MPNFEDQVLAVMGLECGGLSLALELGKHRAVVVSRSRQDIHPGRIAELRLANKGICFK